jgi:hypothetical protein
LWLLAALLAVQRAEAERRFEIGVRANALHAPSSLQSDRRGAGITASMHVRDGWYVVATLDGYDYDAGSLQVARSGVIFRNVAALQSVVLGAAIGRRRRLVEPRFDWFWSAGIGAGFVDATSTTVADIDGHEYRFAAEAGTEIHLSTALGAAFAISEQWSFTGAVRAERHYVDIRVSEGHSGASAKESTIMPIGVYLALNYRF